jgi:hypothetical protein
MSFAIAHSPSIISLRNPTTESQVAVSEKSIRILDLISEYSKDNERSILLGWRTRVRGEISELLQHYGLAGWDGEDAVPISVEVATIANSLVDILPDNTIPPEITPEIDGRISLDWNLGKNRILSLSISSDSLLFAAIIGLRKIHGETSSIYEIPKEVKDLLPGYFSRLA